MRRKTVYVFLSEEYADWEISLVMAGLHSFSNIEIITFSLDREPVNSMGNLAVLADMSLGEVDPEDVDLLVLPGSPLWEAGENREVIPLIQNLLLRNKGVAAICGATVLLAREGYLDTALHTSNQAGYLKMLAPGYRGEDNYTDEPATRDGNLITAGGPYSFRFAREIFEYFDLTQEEVFQKWFQYFTEGEKMIRRWGAVPVLRQ
jgi:putative intracellular protease/amidase